jgi:cysteinyl-tRNA synthetase
LTRFYEAFQAAAEALAAHPDADTSCIVLDPEARDIFDRIETLEERFGEAMDDDFNTAQAIGHMFDVVRGMNRIVGFKEYSECPLLLVALRDARRQLLKLGEVLGLFTSDPATWLGRTQAEGLQETGLAPDEIERLIAERRQARLERNFARADAIRDELAAKGIELLDAKERTTWKVK